MKIPPTARRVEWNTCGRVNGEIRGRTEKRMESVLEGGDIDGALWCLDREWDTERVLETNAAAILMGSLALGVCTDRRWLWLTAGVAAFLLDHALRGWCPPLPIIRALGVRTAGEIGAERTALKALRGDFEPAPQTAQEALRQAERE